MRKYFSEFQNSPLTHFDTRVMINSSSEDTNIKREEDSFVEFDYSKLLGRIKEYGYTQSNLAKEVGINETTMSQKLNNKSTFGQLEIRKICKVLNITDAEIGIYFFAQKVRK